MEDDFETKYREVLASAEHRKVLEAERKRNDEAYAIKLVERIVFGAVALILIGVLGAVVAFVLK